MYALAYVHVQVFLVSIRLSAADECGYVRMYLLKECAVFSLRVV